jgi:hypothetical protein
MPTVWRKDRLGFWLGGLMLLLAVSLILRQVILGMPRRSRSPLRFQPPVLSSSLECKTTVQKLQVVVSPM